MPNKNIDGAIQIACTPLPDGAECEEYSAKPPRCKALPSLESDDGEPAA